MNFTMKWWSLVYILVNLLLKSSLSLSPSVIFTTYVTPSSLNEIIQAQVSNSSLHRALISATIHLNNVVDFQSYVYIYQTYQYHYNELRLFLEEFSQQQTFPLLHSNDDYLFGFEYLNSFNYPSQHRQRNSHHFHFNPSLLFTQNSVNIFANISQMSCTLLSPTQLDQLSQFIQTTNIYLFGIQRIEITELFTNSWCGVDAIFIPVNLINQLYVRLRKLHRNYRTYSNFILPGGTGNGDGDVTLYHALLLNLALWEEEIIPVYLETDLTLPETLPPVILFPPQSSISYRKGNANNQQICYVTPVGFEDRPSISSMIVSSHTPALCLALGQFEQIKPFGIFLELGGFQSLARAPLGYTGMTVGAENSQYYQELNQSILSLPLRQQYLNYLSFKGSDSLLQATGPTPEDISIPMVFSSVSSYFSLVTYFRFNGCYSSDQMVHILHDPISQQDWTCSQEIDNNLGYNHENLMIGSAIYQLYQQHEGSAVLPCLISIHPGLQNERQKVDFDFYMTRLGLIPYHIQRNETKGSSTLVTYALGPHCTKSKFETIEPLLDDPLLFQQLRDQSVKTIKEYSNNTFSRTFVPTNKSSFPGIGIKLIEEDLPSPVAIIENILPIKILEQLRGRLAHRSHVSMGANSHFLPFNITKPRSLVEHILLEYVAPLVVGTKEEALKQGYLGAEWWIQSRSTNNPKEYHMDTAITWCRDNGWPEDLLMACQYYPAIGSVIYLTDEGGPTVVFEQTPTIFGLYPPLPLEVGISFPKKNRMLLFKGDRYHGVTNDPSLNSTVKRFTLLVNYWKDKTAGEEFTHLLPEEDLFITKSLEFSRENDQYLQDLLEQNDLTQSFSTASSASSLTLSLLNEKVNTFPSMEFPSSHSPTHIALDRDFQHDFKYWRQQIIPPFYQNYITEYIQQEKKISTPMIVPSQCESIATPAGYLKLFNDSTGFIQQLQEQLCLKEDLLSSSSSSSSPSSPIKEIRPVFVFYLKNSPLNQIAHDYYANFTLENWMAWIIHQDEDQNQEYVSEGGDAIKEKEYDQIDITLSALAENTKRWRESMPGGWEEE